MKRRVLLQRDVPAADAGSCNFCNTMTQTVNVISSTQDFCVTKIRMCNHCLGELQENT